MYLFIASVSINFLLILFIMISTLRRKYLDRRTQFQLTGDEATKHFVPRTLTRDWRSSRGRFPSIGSMRRLPTESTFQPKSRIPQNPLPAIPQENNRMSVTINPLNQSLPESEQIVAPDPVPPPIPTTSRPRVGRRKNLLSRLSRSFADTTSTYIDLEHRGRHGKGRHLDPGAVQKSAIDDHLRRAMLPNTPCTSIPETQPNQSDYLKPHPMDDIRDTTPEPMKTFAIRKAVK